MVAGWETTRLASNSAGRVALMSGNSLPTASIPRTSLIHNAPLGQINRKLIGEYADGWIPLFALLFDIDEYAGLIRTAAENAGRDRDAVTIAPWIPAAVDDHPDRGGRPRPRHAGPRVCHGV